MTRFTRAKGSKASNERLPEEATSWDEMKKQLLEKNKEIEQSKKRKEAMDQRNANYKAFLTEKEESEGKKTSWASFAGVPVSTKKDTSSNKKVKKGKVTNEPKQNTVEDFENDEEDSSEDEAFSELKSKIDKVLDSIDKEAQSDGNDSDAPPEEESSKKEPVEPVIKVKKSKPKKLLNAVAKQQLKQTQNRVENRPLKRKIETVDGEVKSKKKKKGNETQEKDVSGNLKKKNAAKGSGGVKEKKKIVKENLTEQDLKKIEKKKQKRLKQLEKKKKKQAELKALKESTENLDQNGETAANVSDTTQPNSETVSVNKPKFEKDKAKVPFNNSKKDTKDKKSKPRNNEEHSRRKPQLPHKMFINGKEIEVAYVEGFPVRKEDAERLKKLRKEMISKGLPRSEINIALKLERRKAEKAFTREKKKVCFNCRKSGHNLSECPELEKNQVAQTAGTGICFKCGSTEHTHFECKVVRTQDFKFATCFICKEQGHIARQCPDNARGLYPKGGACNVCGDVTHLKKDCPKYQAEQQRREDNFKVETFGNSNPDVLDENGDNRGAAFSNKRVNKVIKF